MEKAQFFEISWKDLNQGFESNNFFASKVCDFVMLEKIFAQSDFIRFFIYA